MNRINDWKGLLKIANEDLALYGYALEITDENDPGFFECNILKDGEFVEGYAANYYEDELSGLVNDAWYYVKSELV